jgi:hypothetical protein
MEKIYVYYGDNKAFKKLANMSYSLTGLSFIGGSVKFCGLKLSQKLERKIKLFQFSAKKPRRIVYLHNVISNSTILSEKSFENLQHKSWQEKQSKRRSYSTTYKKMPKGITKDNQEAFNRTGGSQSGGSYKMFCTKCHFTHKPYKYSFKSKDDKDNFRRYSGFFVSADKDKNHCPNCSAEDSYITLYSSVRVPRKKASKKVWENFYKLYVYPKIKK